MGFVPKPYWSGETRFSVTGFLEVLKGENPGLRQGDFSGFGLASADHW
jgi:hypothetical protein